MFAMTRRRTKSASPPDFPSSIYLRRFFENIVEYEAGNNNKKMADSPVKILYIFKYVENLRND